MDQASQDPTTPHESTRVGDETADGVTNGNPKPRFSTKSTILFAMAALGLLIYQARPYYLGNRLQEFSTPDLTVIRVTERDMEYYDALQRARSYEKVILFDWLYSREESIDELVRIQGDALQYCENEWSGTDEDRQNLRAHFIVLLAENGRFVEAQTELDKLRSKENFGAFVSAMEACYSVRTAYLPKSLEEQALEPLRVGWAGDRLASRLAALDGRLDDARWYDERVFLRGEDWLGRSLTIMIVIYLLAIAGLLCLVPSVRVEIRDSMIKDLAPWDTGDGIGVFVRGEVWGSLLYLAVLYVFLSAWAHLAFFWYSLFVSLPAIGLIHYHLMRPQKLKWLEHFGYDPTRQKLMPFIAFGFGAFALDQIGANLINAGFDKAGLIPHCTEWIDEGFLFDPPVLRFLSLINCVVWAPLFEEIMFRGLLFATLRRHLTFLPAALISSCAFGLIHFGTAPSFIGITFTGFVYAFFYERTRSLIPCMIAHALGNFIWAWSLIWSYGS